ncbi:hypothetical protein KR018_000163 [Drosophila ironensis]|nr:hypothetical protein KR018_000163 [Drosophila ironensis]
MKLLIVLAVILTIWLSCLALNSNADCCKPSYVRFKVADNGKGHGCKSFGGKKEKRSTTCKVKLCGNGEKVVGTWCGYGRCNPRGCKCKKGCIVGDALANFTMRHGSDLAYAMYA